MRSAAPLAATRWPEIDARRRAVVSDDLEASRRSAGAPAVAKPSMRSGMWRRVKSEPTNRTTVVSAAGASRARIGGRGPAKWCQGTRLRSSSSVDAQPPHDLTLREFGNRQDARARRGSRAVRAARRRNPSRRCEPFRVRGKRHVVDGNHQRHRTEHAARVPRRRKARPPSFANESRQRELFPQRAGISDPAWRANEAARAGCADDSIAAPGAQRTNSCDRAAGSFSQRQQRRQDIGRRRSVAPRSSRASMATRILDSVDCRERRRRHRRWRSVAAAAPHVNVRARADPGRARFRAAAVVRRESLERVRQRRDVGGIDQHAGVPDHFRKRSAVRCDDRNARRHRFESRQAETLVERRHNEHPSAGVEGSRSSSLT